MRCPDCAYNKPLAIAKAVQDAQPGLAAVSGILTGIAGAYIMALAAHVQPLLTFLLAPFYGRFVADAVLSFAGNARGRKVEALGVGSLILGSLAAIGTPFAIARVAGTASLSGWSQIIVGAALGLAVAFCYNRLKQPQS
jgi:hypothetical protein